MEKRAHMRMRVTNARGESLPSQLIKKMPIEPPNILKKYISPKAIPACVEEKISVAAA